MPTKCIFFSIFCYLPDAEIWPDCFMLFKGGFVLCKLLFCIKKIHSILQGFLVLLSKSEKPCWWASDRVWHTRKLCPAHCLFCWPSLGLGVTESKISAPYRSKNKTAPHILATTWYLKHGHEWNLAPNVPAFEKLDNLVANPLDFEGLP